MKTQNMQMPAILRSFHIYVFGNLLYALCCPWGSLGRLLGGTVPLHVSLSSYLAICLFTYLSVYVSNYLCSSGSLGGCFELPWGSFWVPWESLGTPLRSLAIPWKSSASFEISGEAIGRHGEVPALPKHPEGPPEPPIMHMGRLTALPRGPEHAQGPPQGTLRSARVRQREPRDRSEVPRGGPATPREPPSMTMEHYGNISKIIFFIIFGHICKGSGAARLP